MILNVYLTIIIQWENLIMQLSALTKWEFCCCCCCCYCCCSSRVCRHHLLIYSFTFIFCPYSTCPSFITYLFLSPPPFKSVSRCPDLLVFCPRGQIAFSIAFYRFSLISFVLRRADFFPPSLSVLIRPMQPTWRQSHPSPFKLQFALPNFFFE